MTAVEKLEAAIAKLEAIKAATPGAWEVDTNAPFSRDLVGIFVPKAKRYAVKFNDREQPKRATADALVTLHRTIEPQLAILRTALQRYRKSSIWSDPQIEAELALADAILGGA